MHDSSQCGRQPHRPRRGAPAGGSSARLPEVPGGTIRTAMLPPCEGCADGTGDVRARRRRRSGRRPERRCSGHGASAQRERWSAARDRRTDTVLSLAGERRPDIEPARRGPCTARPRTVPVSHGPDEPPRLCGGSGLPRHGHRPPATGCRTRYTAPSEERRFRAACDAEKTPGLCGGAGAPRHGHRRTAVEPATRPRARSGTPQHRFGIAAAAERGPLRAATAGAPRRWTR